MPSAVQVNRSTVPVVFTYCVVNFRREKSYSTKNVAFTFIANIYTNVSTCSDLFAVSKRRRVSVVGDDEKKSIILHYVTFTTFGGLSVRINHGRLYD